MLVSLALLTVGFVAVVGGVALLSVPASLIVAGLLIGSFALIREGVE